jgi:hypothetical protein
MIYMRPRRRRCQCCSTRVLVVDKQGLRGLPGLDATGLKTEGKTMQTGSISAIYLREIDCCLFRCLTNLQPSANEENKFCDDLGVSRQLCVRHEADVLYDRVL